MKTIARACARLAFACAPAVFACGGNGPPPVTTLAVASSAAPSVSASVTAEPEFVYPPDGDIPKLRTGAATPFVVDDVVAAHVTSRFASDLETLLVTIALSPEQAEHVHLNRDASIAVDIARGANDPRPYAFVDYPPNAEDQPSEIRVWVRRPASKAGAPVVGDVYTPTESSRRGAVPGMHLRFRADDAKSAKLDATLEGQWMRALALDLRGAYGRGPWHAYASVRLETLAKKTAAKPNDKAIEQSATQLLDGAIDATEDAARTLTSAVTEPAALEKLAHEKATIAASTLTPPALPKPPWAAMLARSKAAAPNEPLAQVVPADCYFIRSKNVASLVKTLEHVDAWGAPMFHVLRERTEDRALFDRYEAELAVDRGALASALGPMAIDDIAIAGSDPYLVEGSDVSIVMRAKNRALLDAGLSAALTTQGSKHGGVTTETRTHDGVTVTVAKSPDGAIRRQRASLGDLEVISNSPAAIDRVIDASHGKLAKLADESDFKTMLARDPSPRSAADQDTVARGDVLVYAGERHLRELAQPKQRILEARRQLALVELSLPGYAALLYGHMMGKSPASAKDLERAKLLDAHALANVTWKPGEAPRSSWGSPGALTPLVDLPWNGKITESEKRAYERFAQYAPSSWKSKVQPFAARLAVEDARVVVDAREPLVGADRDMREMEELVGDTRIDMGTPSPGARAVMAIGGSSPLRKELEKGASLFLRGKDFSLDWLGDWVALGVLDRAELAQTALAALDDELPQAPASSAQKRLTDEGLIATLPYFFELAVRNPAGAAMAIGALRAVIEEIAPGMLEWTEAFRHKGVPVVRVSFAPKDDGMGMSLFSSLRDAKMFYAFASNVLVVASNEIVMRKLIDERVANAGPRGLAEAGRGTQLAFDIGGDRGRAIDTTLGWLLEAALVDASEQSRRAAAALLYGAPDRADAARALGLAYFGAAPLAPDGGSFTLAPDGVKDPIRGTLHAPVWPDVPVAGSPAARALAALARARVELGLDDESGANVADPVRSLHVRVTVERR